MALYYDQRGFPVRGHLVEDPRPDDRPRISVEEMWRRVTGQEPPPPLTPEEKAAWDAEQEALDEQCRRFYGDSA
jgi:hypothetical protein